MPIKLSTIEVVKHYLLDDGSLLTVVAEQFNGVKARTFDARMIAPLSVPNSGSIQFHTKSMLYRAGVATALSLKECSLLDPETGKKILTPSPNEIDKFLDNAYLFKIPTKSAFTEEYESSPEYIIKTCEDVSKDVAVIWLKLGEETVVKDEGGCVILEGQTEDDLIRIADGLVFYLMGMVG